MLRIENVRVVDGSGNAVVDIQVSTVAELPELGGSLYNMSVCSGSIAQVIRTGKFYTLDENGTWYDTDGNTAD